MKLIATFKREKRVSKQKKQTKPTKYSQKRHNAQNDQEFEKKRSFAKMKMHHNNKKKIQGTSNKIELEMMTTNK